jgi:hypothetical protein
MVCVHLPFSLEISVLNFRKDLGLIAYFLNRSLPKDVHALVVQFLSLVVGTSFLDCPPAYFLSISADGEGENLIYDMRAVEAYV